MVVLKKDSVNVTDKEAGGRLDEERDGRVSDKWVPS